MRRGARRFSGIELVYIGSRQKSTGGPAKENDMTDHKVVSRADWQAARDELLRVRALYLDIAQWATEEPARWAQWAVPSPVSDTEISGPRTTGAGRPGWTSGPASGCPSCPC